MFSGSYNHTVDAKGRVIVPVKFRSGEENETFILTKGTEKCVFVYTQEEWQKIQANLDTLPITTNPQAAAFARFFLSGVFECETDKMGRINIPSELREYAGISKDAKVVGVRNRAEIWDSETWIQYNQAISMEDILSNMNSLGMNF